MSNTRQPVAPGDIVHFLIFLALALGLWYVSLRYGWPFLWTLGGGVVWAGLLVSTLDWTQNDGPAIGLLSLHSLWFWLFWIWSPDYDGGSRASIVRCVTRCLLQTHM